MLRRPTTIDDGVITVSNVFAPDECLALVARAEAIGFAAASVRTSGGPEMIPHIRNNDRVTFHDTELASDLWERIRPYLPDLDGQSPCGIDSQLRVYRYFPGQYFKRHRDGAVTNERGQSSKLSYLIYLNDDCVGGATTFRDYVHLGGAIEKTEFQVIPTKGTALLFRHERWHESSPLESGSKYVLRSDVFYSE